MQYQHGGSRSRMAPFPRGGGGGYSRGQKQFYPPAPPPPPPPIPAVSPPPRNKYEVLMEAGRLAAEYLVATGVLPPGSLPVRSASAGAWGQLPPPPPLPAAQQAPAVYHNPRNDRDRAADREYSNPSGRSRRSRGGDYSSSNSSNYSRRGKRKFGDNNRHSDWGRDMEWGRGHSDSRSYDEEDEDGAPGFRRARQGSTVVDEVGSSVSGGEGRRSKVEAMGESELEDTGSKVSSSNNIQKNDGAAQAMEDKNEANKIQEDKSPDSEVISESRSNIASSDVVQGQETEPKHLPVPFDGKLPEERHEDSSALPEKIEDCETLDDKAEVPSDAKLSVMENSSHDNARNLLNYCSFARVPKRPRSVLAQRNAGSPEREIPVAEQVDLVSSEEVDAKDGGAIGNSITDIQSDRNDDLVCPEHNNQTTDCNQVAEPVTLHEKETQVDMEVMTEQSDKTQHYGHQENTECSEISPPTAPCHNNLTWQVENGIQIYNIDTLPQGEELIDSSDKGKTAVPELSPNIGAESVVAMEEQNLGQSSSFKIRDLNLTGSPDEIRNDPNLGQCSTAECSVELQDKRQSSIELEDKQQINFGVDNNANNMSSYALLSNKEVIDIEDDSPIADGACDTSKVKTEMDYPNMENMMSTPLNTNILQDVQDGYSIAIPDYLGADMPCYQPIQSDLQPGMSLINSAGITVMEDSIYGSLGDIGFMEVWDQPPQDYEKFF